MENILKSLMTARCKVMNMDNSRCYKKGKCDGQCADFQVALMDLEIIKNKENEKKNN